MGLSIERKTWTPEEDHILAKAHVEYGNQWDKISERIERWDAKAVQSRWNNTRFERIEQGLQKKRIGHWRRITSLLRHTQS